MCLDSQQLMLDPCAPNPNYQNYKYDGSSFLPMICDLEMFEVGPGGPEVGEGPRPRRLTRLIIGPGLLVRLRMN